MFMNVFDKLTDFKYKNNTGLFNLSGGFFVLLVKKMFENSNKPVLIVTANMLEARTLYNKFLDDKVVLFEDDEISFSDGNSVSPELKVDRINVLNDIVNNSKKVILTDVRGFTRKLLDVKTFSKRNVFIKKGSSFSQEKLLDQLVSFGYNRVSMVEKMGDFALRGFILDIFPINAENPIRIEFFDDDIESIRYFDLDSQKSIDKVNEFLILPFNEISNGTASLYDYLDDPIVFYKDYNQIKFSYKKFISESFEIDYDYSKYYFDFDTIKVNNNLYYFDFDSDVSDFSFDNTISFGVKPVPMFGENIGKINKFLENAISAEKTVVLCIKSLNINKFLDELDVSYVLTDSDSVLSGKVNVVKEKLAEGFEKDNYIFLTDYELFGRKSVIHRKTRFKNTSRIRDLSKLEIGDYVVHSLYGIGVYNGIKALKKSGILGDYLEILYAKGDKLYIPASKIELISKYNGK